MNRIFKFTCYGKESDFEVERELKENKVFEGKARENKYVLKFCIENELQLYKELNNLVLKSKNKFSGCIEVIGIS
jgi:hypothetical protein